MDQGYWVIEYVKVFLVYMFTMYLWPSVVFSKHLSGKSRAYRFCFCVNMSVLVISTGVLVLGLVNLLNQVLVMVLFWAVFIIQLVRNYDLGLSRFKDIKSVLNKTMSVRRMFLKWNSFNVEKLKSFTSRWWSSTKGRRLEYLFLCLIIAFAIAYFSINALEVHCYGCGDEYVHHSWIYSLSQGKIFVKGIYPEGMHCYIYVLGTAFPISFYSLLLFLAGIHVSVYIVSAYLLGRQLFGWRMSGMLAIVGFLTVEQVVADCVVGISRFAWTLPQEFALYAVFMAPYALVGFFRQEPKRRKERFRPLKLSSWRAYFSDRYLFILITTVAVSISAHFYATILAAFACIVVVFVYFRRLFRRGVFIKLVTGGLIALLIAVAPMVGAFAEGYPLEGSLYWAMSVMSGSSDKTDSSHAKSSSNSAFSDKDESSYESTEPSENKEKTKQMSSLTEKAKHFVSRTYLGLYGEQRGKLLFLVDVAVVGFSFLILLCHGIINFIRKRMNKKRARYLFKAPEGYLIIALTVAFLFMQYKPRLLGLPSVISGPRVTSSIDFYSMFLYACAFDVLFTLLRPLLKERFLKPLSVLACGGIYFFTQYFGIFHGFLHFELTRYPVAVELTKEIVENMPSYQYTIISTTDELYQVIEGGFHEEWIDFLEKRRKATYTIPTSYLFFFIEKHPIHYVHHNFASGPAWLGAEKYVELFGITGVRYPTILHGEVSEEEAKKDLGYGVKRSETASKLKNRVILESKAYMWYKEFSEMYPNDGEVIYEDDDFMCYCVHQNEFSLFSLGIMKD
ncbi:MAG: hypothetical protein IIU14_08950 [Ruminococcus sp.]|nr:hypothetical protein [Ruminococcus sp.]